MPDFWYVLGYNYEVIVCPTLEAAKEMQAEREDADYYFIFEGKYGEEFSGWIGHDKGRQPVKK